MSHVFKASRLCILPHLLDMIVVFLESSIFIMTKQTWQKIYSAGEQLNRYPYDFIVSNFFRYRAENEKPLKVLDLGCGAGNHALFCAENGADVLAIDYSEAALDVVAQRAVERGLDGRIRTQQADFENFLLAENGFDMMIDRLAVSHVGRQYAISVYDKVYEALNDDGIVLSNLFTSGHTHKEFGEYDVANEIWHGFTEGIFEHLKTACFYSEEEVRHLFRKFSLQSLVRETEQDMLCDEHAKNDQLEIWKIIAKKIK